MVTCTGSSTDAAGVDVEAEVNVDIEVEVEVAAGDGTPDDPPFPSVWLLLSSPNPILDTRSRTMASHSAAVGSPTSPFLLLPVWAWTSEAG